MTGFLNIKWTPIQQQGKCLKIWILLHWWRQMLFLHHGCITLVYPECLQLSVYREKGYQHKSLEWMSRTFSCGIFGIIRHIIPVNWTYPQWVFNDCLLVLSAVHSLLNLTICRVQGASMYVPTVKSIKTIPFYHFWGGFMVRNYHKYL